MIIDNTYIRNLLYGEKLPNYNVIDEFNEIDFRILNLPNYWNWTDKANGTNLVNSKAQDFVMQLPHGSKEREDAIVSQLREDFDYLNDEVSCSCCRNKYKRREMHLTIVRSPNGEKETHVHGHSIITTFFLNVGAAFKCSECEKKEKIECIVEIIIASLVAIATVSYILLDSNYNPFHNESFENIMVMTIIMLFFIFAIVYIFIVRIPWMIIRFLFGFIIHRKRDPSYNSSSLCQLKYIRLFNIVHSIDNILFEKFGLP